MDWASLAVAWGPALPLILFYLKLNRDLIYKIVPEGFQLVRDQIHAGEVVAQTRHLQHISHLEKLQQTLERTENLLREQAANAAVAKAKKKKRSTPKKVKPRA